MNANALTYSEDTFTLSLNNALLFVLSIDDIDAKEVPKNHDNDDDDDPGHTHGSDKKQQQQQQQQQRIPILVYGASTTTGATATQLLRLMGYDPLAMCKLLRVFTESPLSYGGW
ncbi:hypothetical protein SAMD00023353_1901080 [Rosellinia necatrix]|uniref:Uncharacterized protein n=1 Tax=Rosellinia necatrix TaxID=77044 RepID=A0A1S8A7P5_ROSNE|nr:hypothetical protein SAMD00023353_1901080 [Rosellinia necatrix]